MNSIIINFLLARDMFMPEIHLGQPGFMHSACGLFKDQKTKKVYKKFKKTRTIYISESIRQGLVLTHIAYSDYEDLTR